VLISATSQGWDLTGWVDAPDPEKLLQELQALGIGLLLK
jgi:hypothetical protein